MKKQFLFITFFLALNACIFCAELQIRLLPSYSFYQGISNISAGGIISLDFAPLKFRTNDSLFISAQGSFFNLFENGISSEQYIDYNAAIGYNLRLSDRFYLYPELNGGIWTIRENKKEELPVQNGFFAGARLNNSKRQNPTAGIV